MGNENPKLANPTQGPQTIADTAPGTTQNTKRIWRTPQRACYKYEAAQ